MKKFNIGAVVAGFIVAVLAVTSVSLPTTAAGLDPYQLVSVNNTGNGQGGDGHSQYPLMSANGRYVVFKSAATNLVNSDTNGVADVFRRDIKTNTTIRVSVSSAGVQANAQSDPWAISENGRYMTYTTAATTLEGGSTPYALTYLHDAQTGTNTVIKKTGWNNSLIDMRSISNDGRFVIGTATPPLLDVNGVNVSGPRAFIYEVATNTFTRIAPTVSGNEQQAGEGDVRASCDGSIAVFASHSTDLVSATDTNGTTADVFIVDLRTGYKITNITHAFNGPSTVPRISCNGNYVVFESTASNVPGAPTIDTSYFGDRHLYQYDRLSGEFALADQGMDSNSNPAYNPNLWGVTDDGKVLFDALLTSSSATRAYVIRNVEDATTEFINTGAARIPALGVDKAGKKIVISSSRSDLVSSDTNARTDVFVSQVN